MRNTCKTGASTRLKTLRSTLVEDAPTECSLLFLFETLTFNLVDPAGIRDPSFGCSNPSEHSSQYLRYNKRSPSKLIFREPIVDVDWLIQCGWEKSLVAVLQASDSGCPFLSDAHRDNLLAYAAWVRKGLLDTSCGPPNSRVPFCPSRLSPIRLNTGLDVKADAQILPLGCDSGRFCRRPNTGCEERSLNVFCRRPLSSCLLPSKSPCNELFQKQVY